MLVNITAGMEKRYGAVAIAGGREELFRKKFLSPPCTPLTLQKLFEKWDLRQIFCKTKHSF